MPASLLLSQFLPLPAIKLRRFVTSVDEPHRDYHDLNDGSSFKIVKKVESHYDSIDSLADYRTFTSELASLLSASFSKRHKTSIRITTNQVKTYYLNNYGGLGMLCNRKTFGDGLSKLWMKGKISMSCSGGHTEDQQRQFVAQGEQIIAVQYRKVCFKWFSSKTADKATLAKKTQWERYDQPRYLHGDGEDRVEVDLEDDLALEGDREKYTIESGEILFSALDLDGEEE